MTKPNTAQFPEASQLTDIRDALSVIEVMVNFYLESRLKDWGVDPENYQRSKCDPTTLHKLDVCETVINHIRDIKFSLSNALAKSMTPTKAAEFKNSCVKQCIELSYYLYDLEVKEIELVKDTWGSKQPFIACTLLAARSYLKKTIELTDEYVKTVENHDLSGISAPVIIPKKLEAIMQRDSLSIADATENYENCDQFTKQCLEFFSAQIKMRKLNALHSHPVNLDGYFKTFFDTRILPADSVAKNKNEKSFTDFSANVINGLRKPDICDKIFPYDPLTNKQILTSSHDHEAASPTSDRGKSALGRLTLYRSPIATRSTTSSRTSTATGGQQLQTTASSSSSASSTSSTSSATKPRFGS